MAKDCSFDVVSEVDLQEVDNAVNQTKKEIGQRYDFKGSKIEVELSGEEIKLLADNDFQMTSVVDILQNKAVKRGISLKSLELGKIEPSGKGVKQMIKVIRGIDKEKAKSVINDIKQSKIKVQAQIMEEKLRITGRDKDDLQEVIQLLKEKDYGVDLQFTNYR